jgi:hypothetical protein
MVSGADITDDSPEYHLGSFREKETKDVMTNTKELLVILQNL